MCSELFVKFQSQCHCIYDLMLLYPYTSNTDFIDLFLNDNNFIILSYHFKMSICALFIILLLANFCISHNVMTVLILTTTAPFRFCCDLPNIAK